MASNYKDDSVVPEPPREGVGAVQNEFGAHHWLITDASPGGSGLPILFGLLGAIHPSTSAILLCVDVSSSFQQVVADTLESMCRELHAGPEPVMDSFICFAEKAITVSGLQALLSTGGADLRTVLADISSQFPLKSTLLEPLVREVQQLMRGRCVSRVVVVSDGAFSDCAADPIQVIRSRLAVPVDLRD